MAAALIIQFDAGSDVPAYLQLVNQVQEAVRLGRLQAGDQLPTVREVVESSGLNPNTVLKAYRELGYRGLIETRAGAGTFVQQHVQAADLRLIARHSNRLEKWVGAALEDGLRSEDIQAIVQLVLTRIDGQELRQGETA